MKDVTGAALNNSRKKEIDRALQKARRDAVFADLRAIKKGWAALLVVVIAVLAFCIAICAAPARLVETATGRPESRFSVPGKLYPHRSSVQVRLEDGRSVPVSFWKTIEIKDAPMTIEVIERGLGPIKFTYYRFAGYVEPESN